MTGTLFLREEVIPVESILTATHFAGVPIKTDKFPPTHPSPQETYRLESIRPTSTTPSERVKTIHFLSVFAVAFQPQHPPASTAMASSDKLTISKKSTAAAAP